MEQEHKAIRVDLMRDYMLLTVDARKTGQRIRALRKRCVPKISQEQLGTLVGVSTASISNWESGKDVPTTRNLGILSVIFDTPIDEILVTGTEKDMERERDSGGRDSASVLFLCPVTSSSEFLSFLMGFPNGISSLRLRLPAGTSPFSLQGGEGSSSGRPPRHTDTLQGARPSPPGTCPRNTGDRESRVLRQWRPSAFWRDR
ncbi:MAG TPA: hypothetical protein DGX96_01075 [Lachnospiraceae bacterium]|nr:hypothetical protein [Lachnospiraceae bacterium]